MEGIETLKNCADGWEKRRGSRSGGVKLAKNLKCSSIMVEQKGEGEGKEKEIIVPA